MEPAHYHPTAYWEQLLAADFTLSGVSHPYLPASFNRVLYRTMERSLRRALAGATPPRPIDECYVLDVGSGVGFWLEFWLGLGVRRLAGIDLTETSVAALKKRFPEVDLRRLDIGDDDLAGLGPFDVVSVVNVLLHLTDDERFEQAVRNLGAALTPGGLVLVIDPVVVHGWWGGPLGEGANSKPRSLTDWKSAAAKAGLRVTAVRPVTVLLDGPVDTRSKLSFRALTVYRRALIRVLNRNERIGALLGRAVFAADSLLVKMARTGPSLKCIVLRRD
jgi:SAM-dependent methyltransferase